MREATQALLDHRALPGLLRVEDRLGRPADLRSEQLPDLEPQFPAELMGEEHALRDVVPFLQRPGDTECHRVAVPDLALRCGVRHAGRDRSTAVVAAFAAQWPHSMG